MNKIVWFLGAVCMLFLSACKEKANNYNLIVVIAESISADSLGCYGSEKQQSLNLDSFSKEAILFSRSYSNTSQSGPFMGMLWSGQHPLYNGVFTNGLPMISLKGRRMGSVLQENGYHTTFIGNWMLPGGHDDSLSELELKYGFDKILPTRVGMSSEVENSIAYLDSIAAINKPFALYLSLSSINQSMHEGVDSETNDATNSKIPNENSKQISKIQNVDDAFGKLMVKVKQLGLDENSIIVFTSAPLENEIAKNNTAHIALNGLKRTPFLVKLPNQQLPISNSDLLLGTLDVMPTTLGLLSIKVPKEVHGRNLAKTMLNQELNGPVSIPWFEFFPNASRGIITKEYAYAFQSDSGKVDGVLVESGLNSNSGINHFYDEAFNQKKLELKLKTVQWMEYYEDESYSTLDILEVMSIDDWQNHLQYTSKRPIDALKNLHGKRIMHFHGNNNFDE